MKHRSLWFAGLIACAGSLVLLQPLPSPATQSVSPQAAVADADFIALRAAALRGDIAESGRLAGRLAGYPIPSYVDYYRLYPRLVSAPEGEIRSYLSRYDGMAIADRLRNDWLLLLGRARDWQVFDEQYPLFVLNDDTQLKCYALMSRLAKGEDISGAARELLMQPKFYGEACVDLIGQLAKQKKFSASDVWGQVRLAVEYSQPATARRIAAFTEVNPKLLPSAIDKPASIIERGVSGGRESRQLFLIALGRLARESQDKAVRALERAQSRLTAEERAIGWAQIALPASLALSPQAPVYWGRTWDLALSNDGYQWRARAALRAGDWPMLARAIDSMPGSLQQDPAWVYWRGRAFAAQASADQAQYYFRQLAGQPHFYGMLASEELGLPIAPLPKPAPPKTEEIVEAAANTGLRDALKFYQLELRFEGNREWNWQLRRLGERQLLAAAEFARQNDVLDRMVASADRAKSEIDMSHRYPTPHERITRSATEPIGLDPAWVYGLIRQESRFIKTARSVVGASGLMQIMPATANYVARKIGMNGFTLSQLNEIETNITLGTQYLNMVLANLGGSQTLATAAYNAGPSRPKLWRSSLTQPVEGAIFAETIPFTETRGYVKNVLANATWYAAMFENRPQSLKARLGTVTPRDAAVADSEDLP